MNPELIIFDCDGVLIDSEGVASRVIAGALTRLGWPMTAADSLGLFMGMSITDMEPMIEVRLGRRLPAGWRADVAARLVVALGEEAKLIPGAREILEYVIAAGIDWRVASNSSDEEMAVKFARTGLDDLTRGRTFSAGTVVAQGGKAKPAPDVYLAAAAGVAPRRCLVIEDSVIGVRAGVAAGMPTWGFDPHGDGSALLAVGAARVLHSFDELKKELEP